MADVLARLAKSASPKASETEWFSELVTGTGRAQGMPEGVRHALIAITADAAGEVADRDRAAAAALRAQEQRARTEELRARARAAQQFNGRLIRSAFGVLFSRAVVSAIIVGLTPVAASFATIVPVLASIKPVVFFAGETGSTTGDGPWTLYSILVWCVGVCLVVALVSDAAFGIGSPQWQGRLVFPGALIGLGIFCYQWYDNSLQWYSWNFAPLLLTAGYVAAGLISGERMRRHRGSAGAGGST